MLITTQKDPRSTSSMTEGRKMVESFSKSTDYRHGHVSESIASSVALQIFANRDARELTQEQLGELAGGMKQTVICRLEGLEGKSSPTIRTLSRLAEAFDCALIVEFVPFSEFIDWSLSRKDRTLAVPSWDEDKKGLSRHQNRGRSTVKAVNVIPIHTARTSSPTTWVKEAESNKAVR